MWETLATFLQPRCAAPSAIARKRVKMSRLAQTEAEAAAGITCHFDDDWGFKVCYDNNGCLLGAKADDMVLVESPGLQNDTLDGDILGSFCPNTP